jgi:hypothetical protein
LSDISFAYGNGVLIWENSGLSFPCAFKMYEIVIQRSVMVIYFFITGETS